MVVVVGVVYFVVIVLFGNDCDGDVYEWVYICGDYVVVVCNEYYVVFIGQVGYYLYYVWVFGVGEFFDLFEQGNFFGGGY